MNRIGIDIGYNAVKMYDGKNKISFPSISGTPDVSRFRMFGSENPIITIPNDGDWMIGSDAVEFSRMIMRREDRNWIEGKEYYRLLIGALARIDDFPNNLAVVTGLPVAFLEDAVKLANVFKGDHVFKMAEKNYSTTITEVRVLPQPFGTILCYALDENGDVVNPEFANGTIGVIDIGGKTTNILVATKMAEKGRQTSSVNAGGWDVVRAVERLLKDNFEDVDLRDHQIAEAVKERKFKYYGEMLDISSHVETVLDKFMVQILDETTKLWGSASSVDKIVITGGGALMVGEYIKSKFRHAVIADDPTFSNVIGYFKLSKRIK